MRMTCLWALVTVIHKISEAQVTERKGIFCVCSKSSRQALSVFYEIRSHQEDNKGPNTYYMQGCVFQQLLLLLLY